MDTQNGMIRYSESELLILYKGGVQAHRDGLRRRTCPLTNPTARAEWERGWKSEQREKRRQYMFWYNKQYREKMKEKKCSQ